MAKKWKYLPVPEESHNLARFLAVRDKKKLNEITSISLALYAKLTEEEKGEDE